MGVEFYKFEPFRIKLRNYLASLVVAVDILADTEVRVDRGKHGIYLGWTYAAVELTGFRLRASYNSVVDVHPIHLDVYSETFHAFRVMLAVELALVESCAKQRKSDSHLWYDIRQECREFFFCNNEILIIDISLIGNPHRNYP